MPGRKPRSVTLAPGDRARLQRIARQPALPFFQVQRARIVLAVAAGEAVHTIAAPWECDPATVWRYCRRYERGGLAGLLAHADRSGRPELLGRTGTERRGPG